MKRLTLEGKRGYNKGRVITVKKSYLINTYVVVSGSAVGVC